MESSIELYRLYQEIYSLFVPEATAIESELIKSELSNKINNIYIQLKYPCEARFENFEKTVLDKLSHEIHSFDNVNEELDRRVNMVVDTNNLISQYEQLKLSKTLFSKVFCFSKLIFK